MMTLERRSMWSRLWLTSISAGGLILILAAIFQVSQGRAPWMWLALGVGLASAWGVRVPLRRVKLGALTITASDCFVLIAIVFLNLWVAILLAALDAAVVLLRARVGSLDRKLFNLGQMAITAAFASLVMDFLRPGQGLSAAGFWVTALLAVCLCGLAYFLTNFSLLTVAMALQSGESLGQIWASNLPGVSPIGFFNIVAGIGFSLPLLLPGAQQLTVLSLLGSVGVLAHIYYSRRLQHKASTALI